MIKIRGPTGKHNMQPLLKYEDCIICFDLLTLIFDCSTFKSCMASTVHMFQVLSI